MKLDQDRCWEALAAARHGVLATVHPGRGVDAVPVVFAVVASRPPSVVIPVDAVKPKRSNRLQRLINLEQDPRCVLLVDFYDDDWSRLWWVRVHARATVGPAAEAGRAPEAPGATVGPVVPWAPVVPGAPGAPWARLAERYPQYRAPGSVVAVITLEPTEVTGWRAYR